MNIKYLKYTIIIVVSVLTLSNCKQNTSNNKILYPYMVYNDSIKSNIWGYMDSLGNTVIKPQFHNAKPFVNGYAKVFVCKQRGYTNYGAFGMIDKDGNMIIPAEYEKIGNNSYGLIRLSHPKKRDNKKYIDGYHNKNGELSIACRLDDFCWNQNSDFSEGLAVVCPPVTSKQYKKLKEGKELTEFLEKLGAKGQGKIYSTQNLYGYINKQGRLIIPNKFDYAKSFSQGLAVVRQYPQKKMGYINKSGEFIINPEFKFARSFSEGFAAVLINNKYGFINKEGEVVIQPTYKEVGDFNEGLAWVEKDNKYGFINTKGEVVIDFKYDFVTDFSEGLVAVGKGDYINNKWGFINAKGEQIIDLKFIKELNDLKFKHGLCVVSVNIKVNGTTETRTGYINKKGEWIYQPVKGYWNSFSYNIL
ncbi:MAG: WG repeat-containing protein [Bacteroidales bacterium]|nr:WG repeat-containing protein [Bacteroidales bacterium]